MSKSKGEGVPQHLQPQASHIKVHRKAHAGHQGLKYIDQLWLSEKGIGFVRFPKRRTSLTSTELVIPGIVYTTVADLHQKLSILQKNREIALKSALIDGESNPRSCPTVVILCVGQTTIPLGQTS